jgi:hypothetical protein
MKYVFNGLCGFFIGFGLIYFIGAFAAADCNVANWSAGARAAIAWFGLISGVIGLGVCVEATES